MRLQGLFKPFRRLKVLLLMSLIIQQRQKTLYLSNPCNNDKYQFFRIALEIFIYKSKVSNLIMSIRMPDRLRTPRDL